jgi:nucleoside-diphosphate-sugar epimerase
MTILITGARGGFGRIFAQWMAEHTGGEQIVLSGRSDPVASGYIPCAVESPDAVAELVATVRPDRIFHLAATFSENLDLSYAVNAMGARHILDAVSSQRLSTRVVLIGSAAEYGSVSPEENPITENRMLRPVSVYGITKAIQSQLAYYYAMRHEADVVVARMFNLIAPGLSSNLFVGRVESLISALKEGRIEKIELGNLEHRRDYIDAPRASTLIDLISRRGRAGEVYHVASGQPVKMVDLLQEMLGAAGLDMTAVTHGHPIGGRPGYDAPLIYADMEKTNRLTGIDNG